MDVIFTCRIFIIPFESNDFSPLLNTSSKLENQNILSLMEYVKHKTLRRACLGWLLMDKLEFVERSLVSNNNVIKNGLCVSMRNIYSRQDK